MLSNCLYNSLNTVRNAKQALILQPSAIVIKNPLFKPPFKHYNKAILPFKKPFYNSKLQSLHGIFSDNKVTFIFKEEKAATNVIIFLTSVCFCLQWLTRDRLTVWGMKINALLRMGQYWRLVTPLFLHNGLYHLAVNMVSLNNIGGHVESIAGTRRFLAVYFLSGIMSIIGSVLLCPSHALGCSGAVMGLSSALCVFYLRNRKLLGSQTTSQVVRPLLLSLLFNAVMTFGKTKYDHGGHIGGFIGGIVAGWFLMPNLLTPSFWKALNNQAMRRWS
uniref:Peptidase S54 rhomboid domain-containing protein n=1 Tax=Polytomella parva TaxID=51329 RepID=A0A7S0Y941_9CHLO